MSVMACRPLLEDTITPAALSQWHVRALEKGGADQTPVDYSSSPGLCYVPSALDGFDLQSTHLLADWTASVANVAESAGTQFRGPFITYGSLPSTRRSAIFAATVEAFSPSLAGPTGIARNLSVTPRSRDNTTVYFVPGAYHTVGPGFLAAEPPVVPHASPLSSRTIAPSPLDAAIELKSFLGLSWDHLSKMTDVNRGTYLYWQRSGGHPRPTTLRKLMRVYSLAFTVARELGDMEAAAWFRRGSPSPLELLSGGDLAAAERAARESLPTGTPPRRARLGRVDPRDSEGVGD
jgi:hypothetical protein